MNKIRQLQIVLIDSLEVLRALRATHQPLPTAWQYCLQKSKVQRLWNPDAGSQSLEPWQHSVLHTLPEALQSVGLASAALCWGGEGGVLRPGTWMKIQLAHCAAGMNDVHILFPSDVSHDQVYDLMNAVRPLLTLAGFEMQCSATNQWYVWCESVLDVHTPTIGSGMTTKSYDVLPSGRDAPLLRRLLTEIQMMLHQHPINQQREQQGLLSLNGMWLSGSGSPVTATSSTSQRIMSTQPYVVGLCDQLNVSCWPVPGNADALFDLRDDDLVLVLNGTNVEEVNRNWLQPIMRSLNAGYVEQLDVYLDHLRFTLHGGRMQQVRRWLAPDNDSVWKS
jgi:hypothetical protein